MWRRPSARTSATTPGETWTTGCGARVLRGALRPVGAVPGQRDRRYLGWPGQAITYKLGERAWLAGRDAARTIHGPAFDLAEWHAKALALGALGLADLTDELSRL